KLAARFGHRLVVAAGLALMTGSLIVGALTSASRGYGFVAAWITVAGIGLGFTLPPSMDVALGALTPERSGVGNGLLQAMRQVGGAIGVAILGTVLAGAYRYDLPSAAPPVARQSAAVGV